MSTINRHPHTLMSTAIAAACAIAFSGCVPVTPNAPKFALYYQISNQADQEQAWLKRWVQETGTTEVMLEQQDFGDGNSSEAGPKTLVDQHPSGSIFRLGSQSHPAPETNTLSMFTWTPTGSNPQPRKIYDTTILGGFLNVGGIWNEWSPGGMYLGEQINRNIYVAAADGSAKKLISTIDSGNDVAYRHAWSPDGSKLAYVTSANGVEVTDVNTNAKTTFTLPATRIEDVHWMADNRHITTYVYDQNTAHAFILDLQNPTVIAPGFINADYSNCCFVNDEWSPQGDRIVQSQYNIQESTVNFVLIFADNRPSVPLFSMTYESVHDNEFLLPAWSHNGEQLAYVKDADNDGDDDVVIADKNGATLKTLVDFGKIADVTLNWSPDDSKLLVTTNALDGHGGTTTGKLIRPANSSVVPLFETTTTGNAIVQWSPNSRYAIHNGGGASSFLTDTANQAATTIDIPLNLASAAWAADSSYVGFSSRDAANPYCTISVINMNNTSTIIEVAQQTSCAVFWSKPE